MSDDASTRPGRLILVPATITLAVTLLRLVGGIFGIAAGAVASRRAA